MLLMGDGLDGGVYEKENFINIYNFVDDIFI